MMGQLTPKERRILVVAPTGADAANTASILKRFGFDAEVYANLSLAAAEIEHGCGLLLFTEEALDAIRRPALIRALSRQPAWSNVPVVLITSGGSGKSVLEVQRGFDPRVHITLLERPLRSSTLIATVEVALGSRAQQYEIRDLLDEREKLLGSLEERVAERTARLQKMVEEMEAFSYSVSHDLRSPLRVLDGYAEALREDYAEHLPPPAKALLARISNAAQRMDRLTQDLLAYTRVANSKLILEPVNVEGVIDDVVESYPALRDNKKAIHIRKPLGRIMGHSPSLTQCFSNLLENAVKFCPPERSPHIEIFSETRGDCVRISVADNGIGIDPSQHARIFGLFEKGRTELPSTGTGIGLAIVKKALERMGGGVGVESVAGKGSRFWVELARAENS